MSSSGGAAQLQRAEHWIFKDDHATPWSTGLRPWPRASISFHALFTHVTNGSIHAGPVPARHQ